MSSLALPPYRSASTQFKKSAPDTAHLSDRRGMRSEGSGFATPSAPEGRMRIPKTGLRTSKSRQMFAGYKCLFVKDKKC